MNRNDSNGNNARMSYEAERRERRLMKNTFRVMATGNGSGITMTFEGKVVEHGDKITQLLKLVNDITLG